jgi:ABC-type branched-subunit amino acid transport system substrate-binding protein
VALDIAGRFRVRRGVAGVTAVAVLSGLTLAACGSSGSTSAGNTTTSGPSSTPSSQSSSGNTASAPGITPTTVTVGQIADISEPVPGLFKSAQVGVQAYFAYINSLGGVNGRKLIIDSRDSAFNPGKITSDAQDIAKNEFAFVGNYTLFDIGMKPAIDSGHVPNISVAIGNDLGNDPNTYSPTPSTNNDYALGPYEWLKQHNPDATQHVGILYAAATASTKQAFTVQSQALAHLGYKIVYARGFSQNETTFTSDVLAMKAKGVKIFMGVAFPDNYAATISREFSEQNFHPLNWETAGYGSQFLPLAGGTAEGAYLPLGTALFLGEDAKAIPAVSTFTKWMKQIDSKDSIALWGATAWASAALFVQALKNAGKNPTRASLVAALNNITSFDAGGLIAPANPAKNIPARCWLLAQVKNNKIVRVSPSPSTGFICSPADMLPINGWTPENR